jgi:tetratricopeptide (TPR) repeat protein
LPRASRLARLSERTLERIPNEPQALLVLARALIVLGEPQQARARLLQVERVAPGSAAAADAQAVRLAIDDAGAHQELESVLRAANSAPLDTLSEVAARARRLATVHASWSGWLAAAVAERRRERWAAARGVLEVALESAPGAVLLHIELAEVLLALDDPAGALSHAEHALELEGDLPRAIAAVARALIAGGRNDKAREVLARALQAYPADATLRTIARGLRPPRATRPRGSVLADLWRRLKRGRRERSS